MAGCRVVLGRAGSCWGTERRAGRAAPLPRYGRLGRAGRAATRGACGASQRSGYRLLGVEAGCPRALGVEAGSGRWA